MSGIFESLQAELNSRERVEGINTADLLDLSPELRRTLVERGLRQIRHFSWRRCAREILQILEEVGRGLD